MTPAAAATAEMQGRGRALQPALARWATLDVALTLLVAAGLCALAFAAQGGVALEPLTWAEVGMILTGGGLAALALAGPSRIERIPRLHGGPALAALALLTALTAASITWSLAPADSWLEANRMLAYLATFAAGLALARLAPGRWAALLHGVALGCFVVCGWALLTKVFPGSLSENELFARLRAPFGYWNSVGLMAALGTPALLWLGARRSGHAAVSALALPGLSMLFVCLMLSYSRGALLALLLGLAAWFVVVPLRLRSAVVLGVSGAAAALVTAWAFAQDGLTKDRLPLYIRSDAGHELGFLLAVTSVLLLVAGLALGFLHSRRPPSAAARENAGKALLGALGACAVLALGWVALNTGQVSDAWRDLTDPAAQTPANTPDRLTATSSVRARYWREALDVHADSKLLGAGAGAYATARKRYRTGDLDVQHAHGYAIQTLADLGWAGLLISLAALAAWLAAAAAALGLRRRDRGLAWDAERVGACTLAVIVVVFGAHSFVDWTWYVPANAAVALLAAGWIAGRGPLADRLAERPQGSWPLMARLRAWRPEPLRTAAAAAIVVVSGLACWTVVQPLRAVHAGDAAVQRLQIRAFAAAADIARIGAKRNPLSVEPLWELAAIESAAGRQTEAENALERAVALQPANAEAWRRLGRHRLHALGRPEAALQAFRAAYYLDPRTPDSASDLLEAGRRLSAQ